MSRYIPNRSPDPGAVERWKSFLLNHRDAIASMDFLTVPTARFQLLHVLFIVDHARRRILHFGVPRTPRPSG